MKKLKKFLCKIGFHYWTYITNTERKCKWCPKHEVLTDWDADITGRIYYFWEDRP